MKKLPPLYVAFGGLLYVALCGSIIWSIMTLAPIITVGPYGELRGTLARYVKTVGCASEGACTW